MEGSLKSVPMHTASQAHPPIPSQSLQAPDTSPWAPESGPIEYTQSQDLTAGTCAAAWMATSHPMLLRTGRGRGDSRPDHFPLKPGQPTSLRRGSLCSGACLTGARDPQSWGWGPAEGNYVVQKPAEPINSRITQRPLGSSRTGVVAQTDRSQLSSQCPTVSPPPASCSPSLPHRHHSHLRWTRKRRRYREFQMLYASGDASKFEPGRVVSGPLPSPSASLQGLALLRKTAPRPSSACTE